MRLISHKCNSQEESRANALAPGSHPGLRLLLERGQTLHILLLDTDIILLNCYKHYWTHIVGFCPCVVPVEQPSERWPGPAICITEAGLSSHPSDNRGKRGVLRQLLVIWRDSFQSISYGDEREEGPVCEKSLHIQGLECLNPAPSFLILYLKLIFSHSCRWEWPAWFSPCCLVFR